VKELQEKVDRNVQLPAGYYIEWGGQFHNMERALHHLTIIIRITIAAIFLLLFVLFQSVRFAALIITVLPLASIGGIIGLFISGEYLSVPASVGFIALWGIAVLNGVVLVSYIRKLRQEGRSQFDRSSRGNGIAISPRDDDRYRRRARFGAISVRNWARLGDSATSRDCRYWRSCEFNSSDTAVTPGCLCLLRRQGKDRCN
jgi:hypothetical protein